MTADSVHIPATQIANDLGASAKALYPQAIPAKECNRSVKKQLTEQFVDHLLRTRAKQFGGDIRARLRAKVKDRKHPPQSTPPN